MNDEKLSGADAAAGEGAGSSDTPKLSHAARGLEEVLKQVRLWWAESNANEQQYTLGHYIDPVRVGFMRGEQSMARQIGMRIEEMLVGSGNQPSNATASVLYAQERTRKNDRS